MVQKFSIVLVLLLCATTTAQAEELHTVYLPLVMDNTPGLGAHVWLEAHAAVQVDRAITYVPVYPDTAQATYHDKVMPLLLGRPIVLGFRNWHGEPECLPPPPDEYDDWAIWVAETTQSYIDDGHNIIAIEAWNEPDIATGGHYWGCWGDTEQSGAQYALLLREVYQRVKTIDEGTIKVLGGALLFGSPHELPPFWNGAISGGVLDNCDAISLHGYPTWTWSNWDNVFDKADTLAQYGKPLWVTETSLLCEQDCGEQFEQDQAAYFRYLLEGAREHGIETVIWFMAGWNGWRNSDLVRQDYTPKPVYDDYLQYFRRVYP